MLLQIQGVLSSCTFDILYAPGRPWILVPDCKHKEWTCDQLWSSTRQNLESTQYGCILWHSTIIREKVLAFIRVDNSEMCGCILKLVRLVSPKQTIIQEGMSLLVVSKPTLCQKCVDLSTSWIMGRQGCQTQVTLPHYLGKTSSLH